MSYLKASSSGSSSSASTRDENIVEGQGSQQFECVVCQVRISGAKAVNDHCASTGHAGKIAQARYEYDLKAEKKEKGKFALLTPGDAEILAQGTAQNDAGAYHIDVPAPFVASLRSDDKWTTPAASATTRRLETDLTLAEALSRLGYEVKAGSVPGAKPTPVRDFNASIWETGVAFVIPMGSGKTSLAREIEGFLDCDALISAAEQEVHRLHVNDVLMNAMTWDEANSWLWERQRATLYNSHWPVILGVHSREQALSLGFRPTRILAAKLPLEDSIANVAARAYSSLREKEKCVGLCRQNWDATDCKVSGNFEILRLSVVGFLRRCGVGTSSH